MDKCDSPTEVEDLLPCINKPSKSVGELAQGEPHEHIAEHEKQGDSLGHTVEPETRYDSKDPLVKPSDWRTTLRRLRASIEDCCECENCTIL